MVCSGSFFLRPSNDHSFELGNTVAVSLECAVGYLGTVVVEEGQHRLVHGTIPLDVARLSPSVAVDVLVSKMENGLLASLPLAVSIGYGRVLGQNSGQTPVQEVGVVGQGLGVDARVVEHDGAIVEETTAETTHNEPHNVEVSDPASHVEVFDGQLTDDGKTEHASKLGTGGIVRVIEVRSVNGACNLVHLSGREPASQDLDVTLGILGQTRELLLQFLLGETETDQVTVLDVLRGLGVNLSSLEIIVGILYHKKWS